MSQSKEKKIIDQAQEQFDKLPQYKNLIILLASEMIARSTNLYKYLIVEHKSNKANIPFSTSLYVIIISNNDNGDIIKDSSDFNCDITPVSDLKLQLTLIVDECVYKNMVTLSKQTPNNCICYIAVVDEFVIIWYGPVSNLHNQLAHSLITLYILISISNKCIIYESELIVDG